MSDFKDLTGFSADLDPHKRVRYSDGLVLGASALHQDQLYQLEKHRSQRRHLHGYGTVTGLDIAIVDAGTGPEVLVTAGVGIGPQGDEIRVPTAQTARLDDWLAAHQNDIPAPPPDPLDLYIVLRPSHRESDPAPIAGGPCKTLDTDTAPTRIADDFELSLSLTPPDQIEEDLARDLGQLLGRIESTDEGEDFLAPGELDDLVRALLSSSPPDSSPPEVLRVHPDDYQSFMRSALRVWTREVRPALLPNDPAAPPLEAGLLLARIELTVSQGVSGLDIDGYAVFADEGGHLIPSRAFQEWLMVSSQGAQGLTGAQGVQGEKGDKGDPGEPAATFQNLATIRPLATDSYEIWFHPGHQSDQPEVVNLKGDELEISDAQDSATVAKILKVTPVDVNLLQVDVDSRPQLSRIAIDISQISLTSGETLHDYGQANSILYVGQTGREVAEFIRI